MKIKNKSIWKTKDLQKFFKRCLQEEGMHGKNLHVTVVNARKNGHSGNAYIGMGDFGYGKIRIRIPKNPSLVILAMVFAHELAHVRGCHHEDMIKESWDEDELTEFHWAKEYLIEPSDSSMKHADIVCNQTSNGGDKKILQEKSFQWPMIPPMATNESLINSNKDALREGRYSKHLQK